MGTIDYTLSGTVFNIQRFSLHDGPGIRTIVFLKGCPLSCKWCSNPESQGVKPVIMYNESECMHCGRCVSACKRGAIDPQNPGHIDRSKCVSCGECANVCPAGALVLKGTTMTVEQVILELKKDATTFRRSGGGVTLSGGEPLLQNEFATEILKACKAQGWTTAAETTGCVPVESIERAVPYIDTVLLDIKHMDAEMHKKFTGMGNETILMNAPRIAQISQTIVRVPVIPGFNNTKEDISKITAFARTLTGVRTLHLLPYHNLGSNKYDLLGKDYYLKDVSPLKPEDMEEYKSIVENSGLQCVIGG